MTAFVEQLLVEALIAAPGCPETVVERQLRQAVVDFYRASFAWRVTTDVAPVIVGRREVEFDLPPNTAIQRVYWLRLDDKPLRAISPRNLTGASGSPRDYAFTGLGQTVQLDPIPDASYLRNGAQLHAALLPTPALEELPDELFAVHRDGILYGALAKLLVMPNVPWQDLTSAQFYLQMAVDLQGKARREADSLQAPVARVVKYGGI